MPKRISRDGSIVEPHAIKLEEMYRHIFDWFKAERLMNKTDVIRNAVETYCIANGGDLESFRDMCTKIDKKGGKVYKGKKNISNFETFQPVFKSSGIAKYDEVAEYINGIKGGHRISVSKIKLITGLSLPKTKQLLKLIYGQGKAGKNFSHNKVLYTKTEFIQPSDVLDISRYIEDIRVDLQNVTATDKQKRKLNEFDEYSEKAIGND